MVTNGRRVVFMILLSPVPTGLLLVDPPKEARRRRLFGLPWRRRVCRARLFCYRVSEALPGKARPRPDSIPGAGCEVIGTGRLLPRRGTAARCRVAPPTIGLRRTASAGTIRARRGRTRAVRLNAADARRR